MSILHGIIASSSANILGYFGNSNVYVGSNSYLTFGGYSDQFSGLNASTPNLPKIMIDAMDNSYQRVYQGTLGTTGSRTHIVRFEGTDNTSGTVGSPTMVWEITFYEATPNQFDIQIGANARNGTGVSGIFSADTLYSEFTNGLVDSGYRWVSYGAGSGLLTFIDPVLNGTTGLNLIVNSSIDDGHVQLSLPWTVDYDGVTYN